MSMGAAVAIAAVLQRPQRFSGLVIVNGAHHRDTPSVGDPFFQLLQHNHAQALARFINSCVPEKDAEPIKHWGRQILERATPEAAQRLYQTVSPVDLRPELGRLTLPTLILHGDADPLVSVQSARALAQALPNAKLVLLPGAGHVPIMTRPHSVAQEINAFFAPSCFSPSESAPASS